MTLVASFVTFVVVGGNQAAGPRVRAESDLVRVDVHPTAADGQPVTDLTSEDFEVREDGVPQAVASVEHVAAGRSRTIVVFLDTYHADTAAVRSLHPTLVRLLDAALAPDDVVAVMTPEMSVRNVTFAKTSGGVASALEPVRQWAAQDPTRVRDPDEQRYTLCFPDQGGSACPDVVGPNQAGPTRAFAPYAGVAAEMAARRHGQRTVQALADLSRTLRAMHDGRKAVLLLSGGWSLFRENLPMARMIRCGPADERGADDTRTPARRDEIADMADQTICDADRRRLAELDLQAAFRRMLDVVNTAMTSVYPLETGAPPRASPERPGGVDRPGAAATADQATLRILAEQTDGALVANLDAPSGGFAGLVQDMSSYYLLTYQSTNTRADGAFRRVDVTVKRRGVTVRARRGYRADTAGDRQRQLTEAVMAGQTVPGALGAVSAALAGLQQLRPSMPVRSRVAYTPAGAGRVRLWAVAEIDSTTSREGAWLGGGAVDAALTGADNSALASAEGALPGGQRSILMDLGEVDAQQAGTLLRVRLRPAGEGPPLQEVLSLAPLGGPGDVGVALMLRRGPTTGTRFVPTADPQFRRTERLRLELPRRAEPAHFAAAVLDRTGAAMALPVATTTRKDGELTWATAEVSLAPLAHGDYVIKLTVDEADAVTAIRVVP